MPLHDFTEMRHRGYPQLVNLCNIVSILPRESGGVEMFTTNGVRLVFDEESFEDLRRQFLVAKLENETG